jgi:hypothetical protein
MPAHAACEPCNRRLLHRRAVTVGPATNVLHATDALFPFFCLVTSAGKFKTITTSPPPPRSTMKAHCRPSTLSLFPVSRRLAPQKKRLFQLIYHEQWAKVRLWNVRRDRSRRLVNETLLGFFSLIQPCNLASSADISTT